jgi:ABC-type antimicrobial peptide transport system permease subunit
LATMSGAAVIMAVLVSLLYADLHSFEYMSKSGIAGSYGSSGFSFWGLSQLTSIAAAGIYIPTTVYKGSFLLHLCQHLLFSW